MGNHTLDWQTQLNGELHDLRELIEGCNNHAVLVAQLHRDIKSLKKKATYRELSFLSKR